MDLMAMEVDNPGSEMSMAHPSESTTSSESTMEVEVDNSPPSILSALPNLVLDMPETQVNEPPPTPLLTQSGRPRRQYHLPKRFRDNLPEPPAPVPTTPSDSNTNPVRRVILIVRDRLVTVMNSFGIWRDYPERPSVDPDSHLTLEELSNSYRHGHLRAAPSKPECETHSSESRPSHWPFSNGTVHGIMQWLNNGQTAKSEAETSKLIHDVILSPNFDPDDLIGFDAHRENQRLDSALSESALRSQFIESSVDILIPSGESQIEGKTFEIPGLLHRKLTSVIREAFESPLAHLYHYSPFKLFQKSHSSGKEERIYGEIFTSDAFLEETERVRRQGLVPPEDSTCKREKVVAAMMMSSDATMLTDFGTAKGWPIYFMLGNLSKYIRAQPDSGAMHHLAYIPSVRHQCLHTYSWLYKHYAQLPESIRESISSFHAKWRTQKVSILTHCRRELMHAVWTKILDDDFLHAYKYGIVIKCADGVERRIYPRFFTYSADYPEK
jgi:hypothetical protein